jgi:succinate dehydrogenase flavin-adding protein (antitoxin of CptAB toxin-antitoxin module)
MGNKSKIEHVIGALERVLDKRVLYCTDEELFMLINDELEEPHQISYTTFKNYKAQFPAKTVEDEIFNKFLSLYKKALSKEKDRLFTELQDDKIAWQRWAWIIERKFTEWNIRHQVDSDNKHDITITRKIIGRPKTEPNGI